MLVDCDEARSAPAQLLWPGSETSNHHTHDYSNVGGGNAKDPRGAILLRINGDDHGNDGDNDVVEPAKENGEGHGKEDLDDGFEEAG